uniref:Uncharacterized protein n=1 Tax=Ditylenchus dipsaci TaxID=166011 RepID=A0A915E759_9BILA
MAKNKDKSSKEPHRLTVKLEFADNIDDYFGSEHFEVLVNGAIKQVLGMAAPPYSIIDFEPKSQKGSISVSGEYLNLIWAALSVYGSHFGRSVAVHLSTISAVVILLILFGLCIVCFFLLPKRIRCDAKGKHVFITGGSKGIGKAIAIEMLERGCKSISIAARSRDALEHAMQELSALCGENQRVKWFELDLSKGYIEVEAVIKAAEEEFGQVDVLINNAGAVIQGGFDELDVDSFEKQIKTNYLSAVYTTSSAAGQCAIWGYTAYSPSKFAIRGFAEALHMELLPYNKSSRKCPKRCVKSVIQLESFPLKRWLVPWWTI